MPDDTPEATLGSPEVATAGEPSAPSRPWFILGTALIIGFLVEALVHGARLGLSYALAGALVAGGWVFLGRGLGVRPGGSAAALLILTAFVSAMVAVRAAAAMQALDVLIGITAVLWTAALYAGGRLSRMSLIDHAVALVWGGLCAIIQPLLFLFGDLPKARPTSGRGVAPVVWGVLLALPLLLVFGALFASADAVFAAYLRDLLNWDLTLQDIVTRLVLSLLLSWAALGLARQAFSDTPAGPRLEQPIDLGFLRLGGATAITMLALVNVLFLAFVAVQAVYLFGGADTLARAHLTHSEYARSGFFELVTVASLVLALVLFVDWLIRSVAGGRRRAVGLLNAALIGLTLVILASALQRMLLYVQEYGLTELRFYTTAFMGWVAVVLILVIVTVLRQSGANDAGRRWFAFGAFVAGVALVVGLNLLNGDALIARVNLGRAEAGIGQPLDAAYLGRQLSADAVPTLTAGLSRLPAAARHDLACELSARARRMATATAAETSWRGANWGEAAARRSLQAVQDQLAAYAADCPPTIFDQF